MRRTGVESTQTFGRPEAGLEGTVARACAGAARVGVVGCRA